MTHGKFSVLCELIKSKFIHIQVDCAVSINTYCTFYSSKSSKTTDRAIINLNTFVDKLFLQIYNGEKQLDTVHCILCFAIFHSNSAIP